MLLISHVNKLHVSASTSCYSAEEAQDISFKLNFLTLFDYFIAPISLLNFEFNLSKVNVCKWTDNLFFIKKSQIIRNIYFDDRKE